MTSDLIINKAIQKTCRKVYLQTNTQTANNSSIITNNNKNNNNFYIPIPFSNNGAYSFNKILQKHSLKTAFSTSNKGSLLQTLKLK